MSEPSIFCRASDFKALIRFVKQIEKHPCLYDQNSIEYSNRELKRRAWVKIAELNNCSVADAKMKWTKIRIAYIRTLRPGYQESGKKTYYLAKYLKFIKPTKLRKITDIYYQSKGSISENADNSEQDEEINKIQMNEKDELLTEYDSEEHLNEQDLDPQHEIYLDQNINDDDDDDDGFDHNEEMVYDEDSAIDSKEIVSNKKKSMKEVQKHRNSNKCRNSENQNSSGRHYREDNHHKSGNPVKNENRRNNELMQRNPCCDSLECNPRKMFLFSLMPDIEKLSENQMRSFRRKVIQILDDVINE